jgi:hypothetical protein
MKISAFNLGSILLRLRCYPLSDRPPQHILGCSQLTTGPTFYGGDQLVNCLLPSSGMNPSRDSHGLHGFHATRSRQQLLFYSGTSTLWMRVPDMLRRYVDVQSFSSSQWA